jgi:pantoate--beta-alanine ligase
MVIQVSNRAELAKALGRFRAEGARVALVPTMGALHQGHAVLMQAAGAEVAGAGAVVVSVFVNPLQFGKNEDLSRYPRTFEADLALCTRERVDVVFHPSVEEVYPGGKPVVTVDPGPDQDSDEGRLRPGHFRGVATVVAKLFGLVQPDVAVFGEKDYEQLVLIQRMVYDLCLGIDIVGVPTVRDPDGLALSSRNRFLSVEDRDKALHLFAALQAAASAAKRGGAAALSAAEAVLRAQPDLVIDYLVLSAPDLRVAPQSGEARMRIAAWVGSTRLIDNAALTLGTSR